MSKKAPVEQTFFGEHMALEAISQAGDRLEELDRHVVLEELVKVADGIWRAPGEPKGPGGRRRWSSEVMLRVLLLKRLYNLSDEQMEYQLRDRLSFLRFAGLGLGEMVPDSRTIWLYGETLAKADGAKRLFEAFDGQLRAQGLMMTEGVMVDATIVEVPRQGNTREDNARIKAGQTPDEWKEQPRKLAQKDVQARWTKKHNQTYYGYKNHVKVSEGTKLIMDYRVSAASVQDCEELPKMVGEADRGKTLHADSGYAGRPIARHLEEHGVKGCIHEKAEAKRPLTEEQKKNNREKSRVRVRVEHPFAFMEKSLGGIYQRCIGLVRNAHQTGMMNLAYNLCRYVQLQRARA